MFKFIPAALAALSLALPMPASAASRVGAAFDSQPAVSNGECYGTANGSKVCWFRISGNTYSVALHNGEVSEMPQAFLVTCGGKWQAFGPFDKEHTNAFVTVFCQER